MDTIEEAVVQFIVREATSHGFRHLAWLGFLGILTMFFGRRWRQMRRDIECLKKTVGAPSPQVAMPALVQTYIFNAADPDRERQLRDAIESETVRGLQDTVRRLPQFPLGDGHSYAPLPDGTNIVTMADGTMRLALPAEVSFEASAGLPEVRFSPVGEHSDA